MKTMKLNTKIALPLLALLLAIAAGGGWFLWQKQQQPGKATAAKAIAPKQLYTCSMHPFIIREKPGLCPVCGMELIKKFRRVPPPLLKRWSRFPSPLPRG